MKTKRKYIIPMVLLIVAFVAVAYAAGKARINFANVSRTQSLVQILNAMDTEADANRTATNLNSTLVDDVRDTLKGDYLLCLPYLHKSGTVDADMSTYTNTYAINGVIYSIPAQDFNLTPTDVVTTKYYKSYAFDVGTNGTIDVNASTTAAGYATYAADIAALPALAADHVRLGIMTVRDPNGTFTPDTDSLALVNGDFQIAYTPTTAYLSGMSSAAAGTAVTEQVQQGK